MSPLEKSTKAGITLMDARSSPVKERNPTPLSAKKFWTGSNPTMQSRRQIGIETATQIT